MVGKGLELQLYAMVGGKRKGVRDEHLTQVMRKLCTRAGTHDHACGRLAEMPHQASYYADLYVCAPPEDEPMYATRTNVRVHEGNMVRERAGPSKPARRRDTGSA